MDTAVVDICFQECQLPAIILALWQYLDSNTKQAQIRTSRFYDFHIYSKSRFLNDLKPEGQYNRISERRSTVVAPLFLVLSITSVFPLFVLSAFFTVYLLLQQYLEYSLTLVFLFVWPFVPDRKLLIHFPSNTRDLTAARNV